MVKRAGVVVDPREFPCDFFLYMKDLVYSIPIDTIEVLRQRVRNSVTTIRNNRAFIIILAIKRPLF
jgi:hypothetical protein